MRKNIPKQHGVGLGKAPIFLAVFSIRPGLGLLAVWLPGASRALAQRLQFAPETKRT